MIHWRTIEDPHDLQDLQTYLTIRHKIVMIEYSPEL
jgi:hypothetical protein